MTKVYKFGGASVKDANAVKNVGDIIQLTNDNLLVVISAMGKTTNALEKVAEAYFNRDKKCVVYLEEVKKYHFDILNDLFENKKHPIFP